MSDSRKRILVVDDDAKSRKLVVDLLSMHEYEVLQAADGEEALALLKRERIHLILMDHHMPGMSGIDVVRRLKHQLRTRFIPVIMLTAATMEEDVALARDAGCEDFIGKPIDIGLLLKKVARILHRTDDAACGPENTSHGR